jgi:glycosyltransferase involved in cell wall biosynthesis
MSKIACFFNGPYLGGAERSFALQIKILKDLDPNTSIDVVIPYLDNKDEAHSILTFLKENNFSKDNCSYFPYDKSLFGVSRSHGLLRIFMAVLGLIRTIKSLYRYQLNFHSKWWVNGNKIGFVCFFFAIFTFYKGEFLWHFRDYPATTKKWRLVWFLLNIPRPFKLHLIANSKDVAAALLKLNIRNVIISVIYNPVSTLPLKKINVSSLTNINIGIVAMSAPWKGLHDIILFSSLYEKELIELGVSRVSFYGGPIYKTNGEHDGYYEELMSLTLKLNNSLVHFAGLMSPTDVFKEVDVLIHSSAKAEPFGRVIIEAYASGIPVITTGLGGAGELVSDGVTGIKYNKMMPDSLFRAVSSSLSDKSIDRVKAGFNFYVELRDKVKIQVHDVFID